MKKDLNKRLRELREGNKPKKIFFKKNDNHALDAFGYICRSFMASDFDTTAFNNALKYGIPAHSNKKIEKDAIQKQIDQAVQKEDYERAAALKKLI